MSNRAITSTELKGLLLVRRLRQEGASPQTLNALANQLEALWKDGYNQIPMVNAIRRNLDETEEA